MLRRVSLLIVSAGAVVVAPSVASAATFTVDRTAAAGCAANVCRTVADALSAVSDGDTISLKASGTPYVEAPLVVARRNVTIEAQRGGAIITSSGAAGTPVLRVGSGSGTTGEGTTLRNVSLHGHANGGPLVRVSAAGTMITGTFLARGAASTQDSPAVTVDDGVGGTTTITSSVIINAPAVNADQGAAAVRGGDVSSLVLQDTVVVSGARQGPAVSIRGADRTGNDDTRPVASRVLRSTLYASRGPAAALDITSASSSAVTKLVAIDSSTLSAGATGAGLAVTTSPGSLPATSAAGDVVVTMVHATIAGSAKAITVSADADGPALPSPNPAGNVTVTADRSIVQGAVTATNFPGSTPFGAANTVKVDVSNSDAAVTPSGSGADGSTTISGTGNQSSTPAQLFLDPAARNFHLRLNAPAVDKGGAVGPGESDRDIDGEPRQTGPATDLGSDEFVNAPPVPVLKADRTTIAAGETVTFDGTDSVDAEAAYGGGVATFVWRFGDGTPDVRTSSPTTSHVYATPGTYTARLAVVDAQGTASTAVASVVITVGPPGADGVMPAVVIGSPLSRRVLRMYSVSRRTVVKNGKRRRVTRRKARAIRFTGTVQDASGVATVELAIRRVRLARKSRKKTSSKTGNRTSGRASASKRCVFFDLRKNRALSLSCARPRYTRIGFSNGLWSYKLRTRAYPKLRPGTYQLIVRATDRTGTTSKPRRRSIILRVS